MRPGQTRGGTARLTVNTLAAPVVFVAAAGVAVFNPRLALWFLLLLIPVGWAFERLGLMLERRIDATTHAPVKPAGNRRRTR